MYGKSLGDFPERFDSFNEVLAKELPEDIDQGFRDCLKSCKEFPVPAEVWEATRAAAAARWRREEEQRQLERRRLDDSIKEQRLLTDGGTEQLEKEFSDLLKKAGLKTIR